MKYLFWFFVQQTECKHFSGNGVLYIVEQPSTHEKEVLIELHDNAGALIDRMHLKYYKQIFVSTTYEKSRYVKFYVPQTKICATVVQWLVHSLVNQKVPVLTSHWGEMFSDQLAPRLSLEKNKASEDR